MEFIFHNSYTILDLVPSTVIFWQKLVDSYVISRSEMKIDLFTFTYICFFPLSSTILLPDLTLEHLNSPPFLTTPCRCSPLKPLRQINLISSPSANKHCVILVSGRSISKIVSSETTWLNKPNFYRNHLWLPSCF